MILDREDARLETWKFFYSKSLMTSSPITFATRDNNAIAAILKYVWKLSIFEAWFFFLNHVEMKLIYLKRKNEKERPLQLVKQITKL